MNITSATYLRLQNKLFVCGELAIGQEGDNASLKDSASTNFLQIVLPNFNSIENVHNLPFCPSTLCHMHVVSNESAFLLHRWLVLDASHIQQQCEMSSSMAFQSLELGQVQLDDAHDVDAAIFQVGMEMILIITSTSNVFIVTVCVWIIFSLPFLAPH